MSRSSVAADCILDSTCLSRAFVLLRNEHVAAPDPSITQRAGTGSEMRGDWGIGGVAHPTYSCRSAAIVVETDIKGWLLGKLSHMF